MVLQVTCWLSLVIVSDWDCLSSSHVRIKKLKKRGKKVTTSRKKTAAPTLRPCKTCHLNTPHVKT